MPFRSLRALGVLGLNWTFPSPEASMPKPLSPRAPSQEHVLSPEGRHYLVQVLFFALEALVALLLVLERLYRHYFFSPGPATHLIILYINYP